LARENFLAPVENFSCNRAKILRHCGMAKKKPAKKKAAKKKKK
jgi:hypothetical protein